LVLFGLQAGSAPHWQNLGQCREAFKGPLLAVTDRYQDETRVRLSQMGISDCLPYEECGMPGLELKIGTMLCIHCARNLIEENDRRVQHTFVNILTVMVRMLESKDPYTRFHSQSVAIWARTLGRKKGLTDEQLLRLGLAGVVHDFGKIGVPEEILNKSERLTDEEFAIMMHHPRIARDLLSSLDVLTDVLPAIMHHHERWDGQGYPAGLKGPQIPFWARIIAIADAYDTMVSRRTYQEPMPLEQILEEFRRGRGTQFDPELTDLMIEVIEEHHRAEQSRAAPPPPGTPGTPGKPQPPHEAG
jgi:HD-GYP domain-containing protein (c-di-GMP phosphodiesterase class II)